MKVYWWFLVLVCLVIVLGATNGDLGGGGGTGGSRKNSKSEEEEDSSVEDNERLIDDFLGDDIPRIVSTTTKWSLEDKSHLETSDDDDSSSASAASSASSSSTGPGTLSADDLMSETERVVEEIKKRFGNPDVIQIVEPPQLEPGSGLQGKKFKLVLHQQQITPVEPITSLLNKRKEPEVPPEEEGEGDEQPPLIDDEGNGNDDELDDIVLVI